MAESMTATMTAPSNVIAGQPATFMVTLRNSGDADATVSSLRLVLPQGFPHQDQPWTPRPQSTVTVSASGGTLSIPLTCVLFQSDSGNNEANTPAAGVRVGALCTTSAGSNFSPVPQQVAFAPQGGGATPPVNGGVLDFTNPGNSALAL
jgi:uncharacterized repeat protein (TIGR01451 family)